jgi:hypothetical protein
VSVLGYSALRTGTLLHGVVLLAAAGPLGAFLLTWAADKADTESEKVQNAQTGVAGAAVVLAVCAGLWILASLPWPMSSPFVVTKRFLIRYATPISTLLFVAVVEVLLFLFANQRDWPYDKAWTWFKDLVAPVWVMPVLAVGAVLVGGLVAFVRGKGLRTWSQPTKGEAPRQQILKQPAGLAATWSVVYGALCFLAAGAVATWGGKGDPWVFSVAWLAVIGVALTLVVPTWITFRYRRRLNNELTAMSPAPASDEEFLTELGKRGRMFAYLVRQASPAEQEDGHGILRLTWRGQRVRRQASQPARP